MANNFNLIVMFFAIFATLAAAAPANVLERALKSFPSSVLCPVSKYQRSLQFLKTI